MWLYFGFPFVFSVGHLYIIVLSSVFSLRQSRKTLMNTWRSGWKELGQESLDLTTIVSWTTAILPNQLHSNEPLSLMILSAEQSPDQCECYSRMVIRFAPMSLNCTQTYTNTLVSHLRLRFNQTYFPVEPRLLRLICWSVVFFLLLNVGGWTRIKKKKLFSAFFFAIIWYLSQPEDMIFLYYFSTFLSFQNSFLSISGWSRRSWRWHRARELFSVV